MENRTDAKKEAVLALTEQVLKEAVDEFKGMKVNFDGGEYDSPLAIFKDIAQAIPY